MNDDLQTAKDDLIAELKRYMNIDEANDLVIAIDDYIDEKIKASNIQAE